MSWKAPSNLLKKATTRKDFSDSSAFKWTGSNYMRLVWISNVENHRKSRVYFGRYLVH